MPDAVVLATGLTPPFAHHTNPLKPVGFLIGAMFSTVMFGIQLAQVWWYRRAYPQDSRITKFLVYFVLALATVQLALTESTIVRATMRFGIYPLFKQYRWAIGAQAMTFATISFVAQIFFGATVVKVFKVRRWLTISLLVVTTLNWWLGLVIGTLALMPYTASVRGSSILTARIVNAAIHCVQVQLAVSAALSFTITAALVYYLTRLSSSFAHTKSTIRRLMRLTFESVGLVHAVSIIHCVMFYINGAQTDFYYFMITLNVELYAVSIMYALSMRAPLRNKFRDDESRERSGDPDRYLTMTIADGPGGELVMRWRARTEDERQRNESMSPVTRSMLLRHGFRYTYDEDSYADIAGDTCPSSNAGATTTTTGRGSRTTSEGLTLCAGSSDIDKAEDQQMVRVISDHDDIVLVPALRRNQNSDDDDSCKTDAQARS